MAEDARLIVLRGNSGAGKSSTAQGIRRACGQEVAWVEQDYVRRIVLNELEPPEANNIEMIEVIARTALQQGFHAVLDGIFHTVVYGEMLARLARDHPGSSYFYYLDIPLEETVRRHAMRDKATAFSAEEMSAWYRERDLLDRPRETIIDHTSSLEATVDRILADTGLAEAKAG